MAKIPLPRYPDGTLMPLGRVIRELKADFLVDSALPSWLTKTSTATSTVAVTDTSAGVGKLTMTALNTTTDFAQIKSTPTFTLANYEAIRLDINGVTWDVEPNKINLGLGSTSGGNRGARIEWDNKSKIVKYGGSGSTTIENSTSNQVGRSMNLSLLLWIRKQQVYAMQDDQVIACVDYSGAAFTTTGASTAEIYVESTSGNTTILNIQQVKVTFWGN